MQFMHLHIFLKDICVKNNCQKKYIVYHKGNLELLKRNGKIFDEIVKNSYKN